MRRRRGRTEETRAKQRRQARRAVHSLRPFDPCGDLSIFVPLSINFGAMADSIEISRRLRAVVMIASAR